MIAISIFTITNFSFLNALSGFILGVVFGVFGLIIYILSPEVVKIDSEGVRIIYDYSKYSYEEKNISLWNEIESYEIIQNKNGQHTLLIYLKNNEVKKYSYSKLRQSFFLEKTIYIISTLLS